MNIIQHCIFHINKTVSSRSTLKRRASSYMYFSYDALMGDGEKFMMVYNGKRVRERNVEREEKKKRERKRKPVWADMMKHSLLCGKEAKVIYTSSPPC